MKELLKGTSIVLFFKVIGAAALFSSQLIISRYFGPQELGIYNIILSILMISIIFGQAGVDLYMVKELPLVRSKNKVVAGFIKKSFEIVLVCSCMSAFVIYILFDLIDEKLFKLFDLSQVKWFLLPAIIMFNFNNLVPEVYRGLGSRIMFSFFKGTFQNMVILAILLLMLFWQYEGVIYALFLAIFVVWCIEVPWLINYLANKKINMFGNGKYSKTIVGQSWPMFVTASSMALMGYVDNLMISFYFDESSSGFYSVVVQISLVLTFILKAINQYIAPNISIAYSEKNKHLLKRMYKETVLLNGVVISPIFLCIIFFPEFFLQIFGEQYKVVSGALIITSCAYFFNSIFGPVGYFLNMTGSQKVLMKIILFSLVLNVSLNMLLIPIYKLNGAAIATLISMVFWNTASFSYLKMKKII